MRHPANIEQYYPVLGDTELLAKVTAISIAETAGPNTRGDDIYGLLDTVPM